VPTKKLTVLSEASRSEYNSAPSGGNNCSVTSADFEAHDFVCFVQNGVVDLMLKQHSYVSVSRSAF
tara:strand:- start:175 stop:372 length:198 start_codon:yes stop_codon:yes gene_type:complete